jgi:hypothetical protein
MKQPMKGNIMNTAIISLTATERAALNEWCTAMVEVHEVGTRPILEGDPRMEVMRKFPRFEELTPTELGRLHFWQEPGDLPAFPLPRPEWAVETEVIVGSYPEVNVSFLGRNWATAGAIAQAFQHATVFVADFHDSDGEHFAAGTFLPTAPHVFVAIGEELSAGDAMEMGEAIVKAGRDLAA